VLGASALGLPLPFLAAHLLWINLVTDSLPALTLIAEPVSSEVMSTPPRAAKDRLIGWPEWRWIGWVGALEGGTILALFYFTLKNQGLEQARSLAFSSLVFSQLWRSFSARSRSRTLFELGVTSNRWLLGVFIVTAGMQLSLHFIPLTQRVFSLQSLSVGDIKSIALVSLITVTVIEGRKLLIRFLKIL
jgi:Ca2+-transporting ATPase